MNWPKGLSDGIILVYLLTSITLTKTNLDRITHVNKPICKTGPLFFSEWNFRLEYVMLLLGGGVIDVLEKWIDYITVPKYYHKQASRVYKGVWVNNH